MEYENKDDKTFAKKGQLKVKAGARVGGDNLLAIMEGLVEAGYDGNSVGAGVKGHVMRVRQGGDDDPLKIDASVLGAEAGVKGGMNVIGCWNKKDAVLGGKAVAKAIMADLKVGPFNLILAAGISTGAYVEDGTLEIKALGEGFKIGKRIGISVMDCEFSIDTLALVGKGWLW